MDGPKLERTRTSKGCEYVDLDTCLVKEYYAQTARPVIILDRNGKLTMVNPAAEGALPLPPMEAREGAWWSTILSPPEERKAREAFARTLRERAVTRGLVRPSPDGRTLAYEMVPLHGKEGDVRAVAVSLNDITEQLEGRRLSEALNVLQETIGSTLDTDTIMQRVVELARTTMGAINTAIAVRVDGGWRIGHVAGDGIDTGLELADEVAERSFRPIITGEAAYIDDVSKVEGLPHDLLATRRIRSAAIVPLWVRGTLTGLMVFTFDQIRYFSPIERDYSRKIGAAVSLALDNALILAREKDERRILQQVVEHSPAAIALLTYPDLKLSLVNEPFRRLTKGEVDFQRIMDAMPKEVSERIRKVIDEAYRSGEVYTEKEVPIHLSSGDTIYWNVHVTPFSGSTGGELMVVASDVTAQVEDRRQIEELVRHADMERYRLQTVLETMPIAIMVIDRKGDIIMANDTLRSFVDPSSGNISADASRLEGRWSDTGEKIKEDEWPVVKALRGERIYGALTDIRAKDGSIRTVMGSASPIIDGGEINGAVIAFSDITAQMEAERRANEARGHMELYLDLLSHDVNNLNAGAKGYLELLLKKGGLDEKALRLARSSRALLDDIARLVENVRTLQKAEEQAVQRTVLDVGRMIEEVTSTYRNDPSSQVRISFQPGERALVSANALLKDVFDNLVGNAIKHSSGPVDIDIIVGRYAEEGKEFVRVDITDTGPGIPDDVKRTLFNRMQRGSTVASGHGLGLYLARTVLEMFGGRIWADDRVPGDHAQGARFVVLIPAANAAMPRTV